METTLTDWVNELRSLGAGAGDDDPLIPTAPFKHWVGQPQDRARLYGDRRACPRSRVKGNGPAGTAYFKPHALRFTVARLVGEWATSPKELKALSQNLSHEYIGTTFKYYGNLEDNAKRKIISKMRER